MLKAGISRLSEIGLIRELAYGANPGGITRALLVSNFAAKPIKSTDRVPEIMGTRIHRLALGGGTHYEISFMVYAGPISATAGTIAEIIHMILGKDTVSGAGAPYTHKFEVSEVAALPSYTLWQKLTDGVTPLYKVYSGFRINTASLKFDRGEGFVSCEISGFAISETADATATLVFSTDPLYSTRNADITIGGFQIPRYRIATVNFDCLADVFNPLSSSIGPNAVYARGLNIGVELDGLKDMDNLPNFRSAFKLDTVQTSELKIFVSDGTANNKISVVIPRYQVLELDDEAINAEDFIPEKLTIAAVHQGNAAYMPYVEILGSHDFDYDSL